MWEFVLRQLKPPWCVFSSVPVLSPPNQWKKTFSRRHIFAVVAVTAKALHRVILLTRGCKQKQTVTFQAPDLRGEEELKGAFAFLLFYTAL